MQTIRLQNIDGSWKAFECEVKEVDASGIGATIFVPAFRGTWVIHTGGMTANIGGNDWRIYTLHPEDCARLCSSQPGASVPVTKEWVCPSCKHAAVTSAVYDGKACPKCGELMDLMVTEFSNGERAC